ncbi:MAG TPA: hypothetical protein VMS71_03330, partial [Candidatus Acidoferrum sp.]|nr:hypothetical protein [Candidatus Acidoferrum sp.]
MNWFFYLMVIFGAFVSSYIVSLYSLAVYLDPEEIVTMYPNLGGRRKQYMVRLAGDSRALMQVAVVYKSFALVVTTVCATLFVRSIATSLMINPRYFVPIGLVVIWMLHLLFVEYLPRRASRRDISSFFPRYLWLVASVYVVFLPVISLYRRAIRDVKVELQPTEDEKEEIVERAIESLADSAGIGQNIVEEDEKEMIG